MVGTLVAAVAGKRILTLCYSPEYATNRGVFVLLMFSAAFYYVGSILGGGIAIVRRFWTYTLLYSLVPLMALIVAWLLIPRMGLMGAAIATLAYCVANAAIPVAIIVFAQRAETRLRAASSFSQESAGAAFSVTA